MECKKQGAKNRVIVIQKEKGWLVLHLVFSTPYFGHYFFQVRKPTHVFKKKNSGCRLTGRLQLIYASFEKMLPSFCFTRSNYDNLTVSNQDIHV